MNAPNLSRLHALRAENFAARETMNAIRPRFERIEGRHANGTAPRALTSWQLFQTPPEIAAQLVALLYLKPGARVLEPSAGLGRLLDALAPFRPSEIVAVEMADNIAHELRNQKRPGVTVMNRDFLALMPEEIGNFDAVAMNPPFTMRSDIRHINHALDFVKPGGRVAALMLHTDHRVNALRDDATDWIELPPGAFKSSGTNVATILASFQTKIRTP